MQNDELYGSDPTDEELDEILSNLDDDLSWEWDEDQLEFDLDEARKPLTLQQRMKKRVLMRRLAPIIARKRKIKMRKRAGRDQLVKRARRAALQLLKKRVAGNKGKNYRQLSPSEKIGIDRMVQKKLPLVDKLAKRLLPKMLKKETERMRKKSSGVNEDFDMIEEASIMEKTKVAQDPDVDERPGTQPKKYFSGVRKKSKEARAKHFERGAKMDDDNPSAYEPAPGDAGAETKPSKHTKKFKQMFGEEVTAKQISDLEKFGDRLLDKFGIDIEFSRHFADRMNDERNNPEIKVAEIQALFKKIARKKAVNIKKHANSEVVLKDLQKDLNLPVAIKLGRDGELEVVHKTIMRKKNFKTPNNTIQYENLNVNEAFEKIMTGLDEAAEYLEEKQIDALKKKSEKTGIPYSILKQVYNRGMAAWRTGHRPGTTPQQWAFARVNSFATKSKGTWGGADKDLAAKARGSMKKEEVELDEVQKPYVSSDSDGKHVMSASGKVVKSFKDMESANKYLRKNYNKLKKEEVSEADPCWDGYKQVGMKKNAAGKDVPNCVPESVDMDEGKVEFEKDKDLPNLRKPKRPTKFELQKYISKNQNDKKDYSKRKESVTEAGGAGEEGTDKLTRKYKEDTPGQVSEVKSPLQKLRDFDKSRQAAGKKSMFDDKPRKYYKMKKPGTMSTMNVPSHEVDKYHKMGFRKIEEGERVDITKDRHKQEKERLKDKHDREMDAARLRDTRNRNLDEAFEMAMQTQAGMGEIMFAKDFMQIRAGYEHHPDVEEALDEEPCCDDCIDMDYGWVEETNFVVISEGSAEYQGRKVKLNNPTRSDNPRSKRMVYTKNEKGNVIKVYFGDPNMEIKRDNPEDRKNFRARHNCDNPGPKWKPRYWSCKFWSATKKVSDLMKG